MAQVKYRTHYRSPPPRKIPSLKNSIHFSSSNQQYDQTRILSAKNNTFNHQQFEPNINSIKSMNHFQQSELMENGSLNQLTTNDKPPPPPLLSESNLAMENSYIVTYEHFLDLNN